MLDKDVYGFVDHTIESEYVDELFYGETHDDFAMYDWGER